MALSTLKVQSPAALPRSVTKTVKTLSEADKIQFAKWIDYWIRQPEQNGKSDKIVETVLKKIFDTGRVAEIAARIRAERVEGKSLTDYVELDKPIVFFDIETSGKDTNEHKIVEISVIKIHPGGREESFTQRLNPEQPIQEGATKVHGISGEDVKNCMTFKQVAPTLKEFFNGSHLAGFNAANFDIRILRKEFERAGMEFDLKDRTVVDVMQIYHRNVPYKNGEKRNLTAAYEYYCGKDLKNAHTAEADIRATVEVLIGQFEKHDLPSDVYKLGEYSLCSSCDFADKDGKFVYEDGKIIFNFGNVFKGKSLDEVAQTERGKGYLNWMLENNFSDEVKQIIRNALEGDVTEK